VSPSAFVAELSKPTTCPYFPPPYGEYRAAALKKIPTTPPFAVRSMVRLLVVETPVTPSFWILGYAGILMVWVVSYCALLGLMAFHA